MCDEEETRRYLLPSFLTRCESILGDVEEQNDGEEEESEEEENGLRQRILRERSFAGVQFNRHLGFRVEIVLRTR